jgi:hypothetical protein
MTASIGKLGVIQPIIFRVGTGGPISNLTPVSTEPPTNPRLFLT